MTTISHSIQSGVISYWIGTKFPFFKKWYIILLSILLGAMPDLVRFLQKNWNDWNDYYKWSHHTWYCYFIPYWNIHIFEDLFLHAKEGGMNQYYLPCEYISWLFIFILITYLYIKRDNQ